ncbi:Voltage-dependent ion-selective channel [Ceratobasidium theobromae]|uniref:Voltage-dependent ion-selective channel n=1 Tax=Ceratobasidium theobromae TaxID=1582974 RepID=A0A5N5QVY2_9AGAM|nr:Voltage-dependent ion-selective channel [Ceratobasidium theobromae]
MSTQPVPPNWKDLGKSSNDLLSKDLPITGTLLEVKTKTPSGVVFKVAGTRDNKTAGISGDVEAKYADPKNGLVITQAWTTANVLRTQVEVENQIAKGLKLDLNTLLFPDKGGKSAVVNAVWKQPGLHSRASVDLFKTTFTADTVIGRDGFLLGGEAGYDVTSGKFTRYAAALGFSAPEYAVTLHGLGNFSAYSASYYHRVSRDVEAGAKAVYDTKSSTHIVNLEVGAKAYLDAAAFAKAKISNSGVLVLGYTQALRPGVKASFGLALDTQRLSDTSGGAQHKLNGRTNVPPLDEHLAIMATYYSGPRVRLPSNRSLQLSDISSSSASSHAHSPASQTPVLIFPAPPSEPGSPYAHGRNSVRRHTRIDWSGRGESVSRVRVDSDASSGSLITGSGWSEVGWPGSALTHERVVRLGSARMMPSRSESVEVEMWEWTSSGSVASRREDGETNYEDALSQIEFAALESRREIVPRHAALEQRVVRLPFRFLLELLGIDGATLMLVERGSHAPESISETGLFGAASSEVEVEVEESARLGRPRGAGVSAAAQGDLPCGVDPATRVGWTGHATMARIYVLAECHVCVTSCRVAGGDKGGDKDGDKGGDKDGGDKDGGNKVDDNNKDKSALEARGRRQGLCQGVFYLLGTFSPCVGLLAALGLLLMGDDGLAE